MVPGGGILGRGEIPSVTAVANDRPSEVRCSIRPRLQRRGQTRDRFRPRTGRIGHLCVERGPRLDVVRLNATGHRVPGRCFGPGHQHAVQPDLRTGRGVVGHVDGQACRVDDRAERNLTCPSAKDVVEADQGLLPLTGIVLNRYASYALVQVIRKFFIELSVLSIVVAGYTLLKSVNGTLRSGIDSKTTGNSKQHGQSPRTRAPAAIIARLTHATNPCCFLTHCHLAKGLDLQIKMTTANPPLGGRGRIVANAFHRNCNFRASSRHACHDYCRNINELLEIIM